MAECHPVAFRWVMQAKLQGAKIIHADPRFTRTTALADIHAPVRAGSDIAFLGGIINYVINSERWNTDPFFKEYVVNYTNAATIINADFKDTEDLGGVFSGLGPYKENEWGLNGFTAQYANTTWQYANAPVGDQGRSANTAQSGEQGVQSGQPGATDTQTPAGTPTAPAQTPQGTSSATPAGLFDALVKALPAVAEHRSDPAGSEVCLPAREEALRPLHAGEGGGGHRLPARPLHPGGGGVAGELRCGQNLGLLLRRRLDAAHLRGSDDRLLRHAAAAPRQHGPTRRWGPGFAWPRDDPGLDRRADPLPLHSRLHAGALCAAQAQHARGVPQDRDAAKELLGQYAQVHGQLPQIDVGRCGHAGQPVRLRLAPPHYRRPLAHADDAGDDGRPRAGHVRHGPEPCRRRPERHFPAEGPGQAQVARRQGQLRDGDRRLLVQRAGGQERRGQGRGHSDRDLFFPSAQVAEMDAPTPTPSA